MPKLSPDRLPKYQKHRANGQGVVTLDGRDFYLGPYRSKASRTEYDRLVGEWQANGRRLPASPETDVTVNEFLIHYVEHATTHYRRADGTPTSELALFRHALRPLKELYGHTLAREFGPLKLKAVR